MSADSQKKPEKSIEELKAAWKEAQLPRYPGVFMCKVGVPTIGKPIYCLIDTRDHTRLQADLIVLTLCGVHINRQQEALEALVGHNLTVLDQNQFISFQTMGLEGHKYYHSPKRDQRTLGTFERTMAVMNLYWNPMIVGYPIGGLNYVDAAIDLASLVEETLPGWSVTPLAANTYLDLSQVTSRGFLDQ